MRTPEIVQKCLACHGTGLINQAPDLVEPGWSRTMRCSRCGGNGVLPAVQSVGDPNCSKCHGEGKRAFGRHPSGQASPFGAVLCECVVERSFPIEWRPDLEDERS